MELHQCRQPLILAGVFLILSLIQKNIISGGCPERPFRASRQQILPRMSGMYRIDRLGPGAQGGAADG